MNALTFTSQSDFQADFKADAVSSLTSHEPSEGNDAESARISVSRDAIHTVDSDSSSAILALRARTSASDIFSVKTYLARHEELTETFLVTGEYIENIVENRDDSYFDIQIGRMLGLRTKIPGNLWELTAREFRKYLQRAKAEEARIEQARTSMSDVSEA